MAEKRQENLALLFHFSYTQAAAASFSSSFVAHDSSQVSADPFQHCFPVQPAIICPLLLSPQLHLLSIMSNESNENVNLVVGSMTRVDHLITSHLISSGPFQDPTNPPEMSYTTQLSDIKQSCVQIPCPN